MYRSLVGLTLFLVLGCNCLRAQLAVSTIRGTAKDASGAAVPQTELRLVNLATNIERPPITTNQNGDFEIPDLQRGEYRLTATHPGFGPFVADHIILESSEIRRVDIVFQVGAVESTVRVEALAAVIATESSNIEGSFSNKRFEDAPFVGDGRNPQSYFTTLPLVQNYGGSIYNVQIAGLPNSQVQEGIDGVAGDGSSLQTANIHDMQEVNIITSNGSAEYARAAYINLVTKGGSNQFHGKASYWHQNSALAARNFFDAAKPKILFHTYDGEFAGRIIRNRTFFFTSYSGQRWPASTYQLLTVPTDAMRQGDFSQLLSGSKPVPIRDPLTGNPFPGNIIPNSRLNGTALKVQQNYLPAPNLGAPGALAKNFGYLFPYPTDLFRWTSLEERIDHRISAKNTIYGRWLTSTPQYVLNGNYPGLAWTRVRDSKSIIVEDTHIFTPNLLNTFRFGLYEPNTTDGGQVDGFTPLRGDKVTSDIGLQGVNAKGLSAMGAPQFNISGYSAITVNPGGPIVDRTWDYADSLTWAHGPHVIKVGGEFRPQSSFSGSVPTGTYGQFSFNGSLTGYGYADFLLGLPFSSQRVNPVINRTQVDSELGIFVQDTYKVNSRLTLDVGLRWDKFGRAHYDDGMVYNFDPSTGSVIVPQSALSSVSPLYPKNINVLTGNALQNPSWRNFVPRLGVAWRPFDSSMVIRGGYGIYNETLGRFARAQGSGPYQIAETYFNAIQNGAPLFSLPNPFPSGNVSATVASQSVSGFSPDTENGKIHEFNFTVEKQVRDVGIRLSYIGSRSRSLNYAININKPQPSLTAFSASRNPYPQFVNATFARNDGAANFNSLVLEGQRKAGQVTFNASFAFSSNYNNMGNLENPYAPLGWGRDPNTSKLRTVVSAIWTLPVGKGKGYLSHLPGIVDLAIGGWQLYWISILQTGPYFSPSFDTADPSHTNTLGGIPDRVSDGNLPSSQRSINQWFDTNAFAVPQQGRFGNSGFNILQGPGLQMHNVTLAKSFSFKERLHFTFEVAAQNLFNHANFGLPGADLSAPASYGVISSTLTSAPGRQVMLRGRIQF